MLDLGSAFNQIAVVLTLATAVGVVALRLRQPLIVGFIAVGILVGPEVLGVVAEPEDLQLLAKIGISLLLFVVGLKLDVKLVRTLGPVALATGLGQVLFTSAVGYVLALLLGFAPTAALYIAVALTFSSTIIIVKLLSDKRETDELHGRIAIGFLIVQDIVVVVVMIGLTAFAEPTAGGLALDLGFVVARGAGLLAVVALCMRYALPPLLHRVAHAPELLVLFAITWAIALAAAGDILGFSAEVGAFLAGFSLASTDYREAIGGRLTSLRDFLLLFFFIDLGATLELGQVGDLLGPAAVLSLFVLVGNPLIVMVIMGAMGYRRRVSFLAGLTVAQISEFSLILAALGAGLGHIGGETVGLITAVGLITIGLSTYLIYNSHALFRVLSPYLRIFERGNPTAGIPAPQEPNPEVIVLGLGRFGTAVMEELLDAGVDVLGVDFDPRALRHWQERGVPALYGDAEDPEMPDALPLRHTRWIVSTVRQSDAHRLLLHALEHHGYRGRVAVTADTRQQGAELEEAGADHVLLPFTYAAGHVTSLLGRSA
jgi:Kef-type K+ transport system membrane component KefB